VGEEGKWYLFSSGEKPKEGRGYQGFEWKGKNYDHDRSLTAIKELSDRKGEIYF